MRKFKNKFAAIAAAAMAGVMTLSLTAAAVPPVSVYAEDKVSKFTIQIDYTDYTANIYSNGQDDPYVILEVLKATGGKASGTYTYPMDGNEYIKVDLSFLKANKDSILRVHGSSEPDGVYSAETTVTKMPAKLKMKYKAGQKLEVKDGEPQKFKYIADTFSGGNDKPTADDIEDGVYEYRSLYSSADFESLEKYDPAMAEVAGTTLIVRKVAKTYNPATEKSSVGAPASAEVKIKVPAAPKAPKVSLDYTKGTIKMKKDSEMLIAYKLPSAADNTQTAPQADDAVTPTLKLAKNAPEFYGSTNDTDFVKVTNENVGTYFEVGDNGEIEAKSGCTFKGAASVDTTAEVNVNTLKTASYVVIVEAVEANVEYIAGIDKPLYVQGGSDPSFTYTPVNSENVSSYFTLDAAKENVIVNTTSSTPVFTITETNDPKVFGTAEGNLTISDYVKLVPEKPADFTLNATKLLFVKKGEAEPVLVEDTNKGTYLALNQEKDDVEAATADLKFYAGTAGAPIENTTAITYVTKDSGNDDGGSGETILWDTPVKVSQDDAKGLEPKDLLKKFFTGTDDDTVATLTKVLENGFSLIVYTPAGRKAESNKAIIAIPGSKAPEDVKDKNGVITGVKINDATLSWETTSKGYKLKGTGFEYRKGDGKWTKVPSSDKEIRDSDITSGDVKLTVRLAGSRNDSKMPSAGKEITIPKYTPAGTGSQNTLTVTPASPVAVKADGSNLPKLTVKAGSTAIEASKITWTATKGTDTTPITDVFTFSTSDGQVGLASGKTLEAGAEYVLTGKVTEGDYKDKTVTVKLTVEAAAPVTKMDAPTIAVATGVISVGSTPAATISRNAENSLIKIAGAESTAVMEYSTNDGTSWTAVQNGDITGSTEVTSVQFRTKAAGDKTASDALTVTVPVDPTKDTTNGISVKIGNNAVLTLTRTAEAKTKITLSAENSADITSLEYKLSTESAWNSITGTSAEITVGESDVATVNIRIKAVDDTTKKAIASNPLNIEVAVPNT